MCSLFHLKSSKMANWSEIGNVGDMSPVSFEKNSEALCDVRVLKQESTQHGGSGIHGCYAQRAETRGLNGFAATARTLLYG